MDSLQGRERRLFIAVPLPKELEGFVCHAQSLLPSVGGLRLLAKGQLHCTLAFIGQAGEDLTYAASTVVGGMATDRGGPATIEGFMFLPSKRRVRVVALRVGDDAGVLGRLFQIVSTGLESAGWERRETRPFRPHISIARLRTPGPLQPTSDCGRAEFGVESVCLYESELRREGAVHSVIARKDLQSAYGQEEA